MACVGGICLGKSWPLDRNGLKTHKLCIAQIKCTKEGDLYVRSDRKVPRRNGHPEER